MPPAAGPVKFRAARPAAIAGLVGGRAATMIPPPRRAGAVGRRAGVAESGPEEPRQPIEGFRRIYLGVMIALFLGSVDQTIVATALPAMARSLDALTSVSWVVISYMLMATVATPIFGRLSDIRGRRWALMVALVVMAAATCLCGGAPSLSVLVAARAVQGFGGGGLNTLGMAVIAEAVPARQRGKYQGYFTIIYLCSNSLGPVLGGVLSQWAGWRMVFWAQLPLALLAILLAARLPRMAPRAGVRLAFDFPGAALFSGASVTILLAFTEFGEGRRVDLGEVALLLAAGALCSLAFLFVERRSRSQLIPFAVLAQPSVWRAVLGSICFGAVFLGGINFIPLYLQVMKGYSATESGALLMPFTLTGAAISGVIGVYISRTGNAMVFPTIGFPFASLSMALMAFTSTLPAHLPFDFSVLLIYGLCTGSVMGPLVLVAQASVKIEALGAATSSVNFGRAVGSAIGVAVATTVLLAALSLIDPKASDMMLDLIQQGPSYLDRFGATDRLVLRDHLGIAFSIAFATMAVFPLAGAAIALTIPVRRIE